jgi:hypothetical protein
MPYGQKERGNCFSIVINALQAKENTKFKQFLRNRVINLQPIHIFGSGIYNPVLLNTLL